jgi:hypothetical protein
MTEKDECDRGKGETSLEHAKADLAAAKEELADAERHVEKALAEVDEALEEEEEGHRGFRVEVLYDGVKKPFEVRPIEAVKTLLDKAVAAFGPLQNPHLLGLFKGGAELPDTSSLKDAGVKPHDVLLLRPSQVRGGQA